MNLPNLRGLGLGNITAVRGVDPVAKPEASFGKMLEVSKGKDSTTGHWEIAGLITEREFPTFPSGFPDDLVKRFVKASGRGGYLGNTVASGTVIIQDLGARHLQSGFPIVYTSADSVFQIAAHEEVIPVPELYEMCRKTRSEVCTGRYAVSRVIARPFVGRDGAFTRTTNRRDFSIDPPGATLLDLLHERNIETVSVGKVDDLFAGRGLARSIHTKSNSEGVGHIVAEAQRMQNGLIFANLVDFDTLYGHRNDPRGFAAALVEFDAFLPDIMHQIGPQDVLVITADHGNDPVTPSTDHSREYVPLLWYARGKGGALGVRKTFADLGKTIAGFFQVENALAGESFLPTVSGI